jgi:hypothetical protein
VRRNWICSSACSFADRLYEAMRENKDVLREFGRIAARELGTGE